MDDKKINTLFFKFLKDIEVEPDDKAIEFLKHVRSVERVVKHQLLDYSGFDEEDMDMEWFAEDPEGWLREGDLPSFSCGKLYTPNAEEGDTFYFKLPDLRVFSFTVHEGECIEASWDGTIYATNVRNITEIPQDELHKYNFVEWRDY